jgi:hypothetical protein
MVTHSPAHKLWNLSFHREDGQDLISAGVGLQLDFGDGSGGLVSFGG